MEVLLGDILSMECTDQAIINRLKTVRLFRASQKKRYVVSILKVISKIHEIYPNLTVENMGETDLIISVEEQKKKGKVVPLLKSVFVVLVTFIGAGFSIMTFNNDVDVPKLFDQIYFLVTGNQSDGFGILELTYCIGMSAGILLFFNHFGKKRFTVDPTPMEVEMRTYEEEIEMTRSMNIPEKRKKKMWAEQIILGIIGFASGAVIAGGMFSFLIGLGLISVFADRTHTGKYILMYEDAIALGGILFNIFFIYQIRIPAGSVLLGVFGLFSGIFVGCWAMALADILNVFPIFIRRLKIIKTIPYIIIGLSLGKTAGALVYFLGRWGV